VERRCDKETAMSHKTAALLLADGFEEIEAVAPANILRRAELDVVLLSAGEDARVVGSRGIVLMADQRLADFGMVPAAVVLPGGMPGSERLGADAAVRDLAQKVFQAGGVVGAICAAPAFTLGPWGLLDGKRATCYPGFEKMFPPAASFSEEPVVSDAGIVTARGAGVALPFAYAIVEALCGPETAGRVRAEMRFSF